MQGPANTSRDNVRDARGGGDAAGAEKRAIRLGWGVVAVSFTADACALGARALFAVTILLWEDHFGVSRDYMSGVGALVHVLQGLLTPISGHAADVLGPRLAIAGGLGFLGLVLGLTAMIQTKWQLWVVYGVLGGAAFGLLNLNIFSAAVVSYMPKRLHNRAVGVATSGSTFGQLALVPLFTLVAEAHGWRVGYAALAVVVVAIVPFALYVLRPRPGLANNPDRPALTATSGKTYRGGSPAPEPPPLGVWDEDRQPSSSDRAGSGSTAGGAASGGTRHPGSAPAPAAASAGAALKSAGGEDMTEGGLTLRLKLRMIFGSRVNLIITLAFVICGITTTGFMETHIVAYVEWRGMRKSDGALAFGVLSGANGAGMLLAGWLADWYSRKLLLIAIFAVRALAYLMFYYCEDLGTLFTFAIIFGLVDYSVVPPVVSLTQETVGDGAVGLAVGILLLWHSIGAAVGAYAGGHIYSSSGGYGIALAGCGGLCALAVVALAWLPHEPMYRNRGRTCDADADTDLVASHQHSHSAQSQRTVADAAAGPAQPIPTQGSVGSARPGPLSGDSVAPGGNSAGAVRTVPKRVTEV